jgi:hypothetical protein
MVLYFIGCNDHAIKIGFTDDVHRRLKQLQTGNPYELKLLHLIDNINPQLETFIHEFLEIEHIKNEWYSFEDINHIIRHLKAGTTMQSIIFHYNPLLYESFIYKQKHRKMPWWYSKIKNLPKEEVYNANSKPVEKQEDYVNRMLEKWNKEHVSTF